MEESIKRLEKKYDTTAVKEDKSYHDNEREAFKAEDRRIQGDERGVKSGDNYNEINSPGYKYRKQDGEI